MTMDVLLDVLMGAILHAKAHAMLNVIRPAVILATMDVVGTALVDAGIIVIVHAIVIVKMVVVMAVKVDVVGIVLTDVQKIVKQHVGKLKNRLQGNVADVQINVLDVLICVRIIVKMDVKAVAGGAVIHFVRVVMKRVNLDAKLGVLTHV